MKQLTFKKTRPAYHENLLGRVEKSSHDRICRDQAKYGSPAFHGSSNSPHHGGFESASFGELERKVKRYFGKNF